MAQIRPVIIRKISRIQIYALLRKYKKTKMHTAEWIILSKHRGTCRFVKFLLGVEESAHNLMLRSEIMFSRVFRPPTPLSPQKSLFRSNVFESFRSISASTWKLQGSVLTHVRNQKMPGHAYNDLIASFTTVLGRTGRIRETPPHERARGSVCCSDTDLRTCPSVGRNRGTMAMRTRQSLVAVLNCHPCFHGA